MDLHKACTILELSKSQLTIKTIKKAYFKKALQWHPDKNISTDASNKFQEIKNAYEFLSSQEEDVSNDYYTVILTFLKHTTGVDITYDELLSIILNIHNEYDAVVNIFKSIDYNKSIRVLNFLIQYASLFNLDETFIKMIKHKLYKSCIIIKPTIDNLLNHDIYNLDIGCEERYCIPLWHHELEFEDTLIVKIQPSLPENIFVDNDNNIHLYTKINANTVNIGDVICINISNKQFEVKISSLNDNEQIKCFHDKGISKINDEDILSVEMLSNVYIHLSFT